VGIVVVAHSGSDFFIAHLPMTADSHHERTEETHVCTRGLQTWSTRATTKADA